MRTGPTSGSGRIRQQGGQQQSAPGLEARFNPCRDSAACTIVMQQRRRLNGDCQPLRSFLFGGAEAQPLSGSRSPRATSADSRISLISLRKPYTTSKQIIAMWRRNVLANHTPPVRGCEKTPGSHLAQEPSRTTDSLALPRRSMPPIALSMRVHSLGTNLSTNPWSWSPPFSQHCTTFLLK